MDELKKLEIELLLELRTLKLKSCCELMPRCKFACGTCVFGLTREVARLVELGAR